MEDLPRHHVIRESSHRILNPFTADKLRQLGAALFIKPGTTMLDLACGKGETLCTWARDYGLRGIGVDISTDFIAAAHARAEELNVSQQVEWVHANAANWIADEPVEIAACIGATWIGGGPTGTIDLLRKSLKPGGIMLIGEPYWRIDPPSDEVVHAIGAIDRSEWMLLPDLLESLQAHGCDVVEMVLADQDSWDRYVAAQWRNIRQFLMEHPGDELATMFRDELRTSPIMHARFQREYLGWGVFALSDTILR